MKNFLKIKIGKVIFFVILDMVMKNKPGPEHLGMNLMKLQKFYEKSFYLFKFESTLIDMNNEDYDLIRFLEYLKYRANHNEIPLPMDEGFILESFHIGVRYFFGVTIDDNGLPMHDAEEPYKGFLEEWIERTIN